jgi:hypothetical protein
MTHIIFELSRRRDYTAAGRPLFRPVLRIRAYLGSRNPLFEYTRVVNKNGRTRRLQEEEQGDTSWTRTKQGEHGGE